MAKYKFAKQSDGRIISANDIANKPVTDTYTCLGCGNLLTAKVNGEHKQPHFAHKVKIECNGETYLHNLGKTVFFETYKRCLENNDPFYITLEAEKKCKKFRPVILTNCDLGSVEKTYDLTDYYHDITIETRDNQFTPDLLISRKGFPDDKIYIEIAVTHFLSQEKSSSGNRIIEIPLEDESDIEKIAKAHLSKNDAMFIGFNHSTTAITDAECKCAKNKCYGFFVYSSGKSILQYSTFASHYSLLLRNNGKIIYSNFIKDHREQDNELFELTEVSGALFVQQVELASKRGVNIRNCFLCNFHGENRGYDRSNPIFCRGKKFTCSSNQAADCNWYKPTSKK